MKGAAKRDSLCELQNSVNQWPPERALHSGDFLRVCLLQCLVWSTLFGSCFWEPSTFVNHWKRDLVYPVRRRSQSSWSSTSCCHHPGAGPSELSTPSGPTQPHWGQSGLPALGLTPMTRAAGRNRTQTLAVMSPTPQPLGHTAAL